VGAPFRATRFVVAGEAKIRFLNLKLLIVNGDSIELYEGMVYSPINFRSSKRPRTPLSTPAG
jgi:hypothetical protein